MGPDFPLVFLFKIVLGSIYPPPPRLLKLFLYVEEYINNVLPACFPPLLVLAIGPPTFSYKQELQGKAPPPLTWLRPFQSSVYSSSATPSSLCLFFWVVVFVPGVRLFPFFGPSLLEFPLAGSAISVFIFWFCPSALRVFPGPREVFCPRDLRLFLLSFLQAPHSVFLRPPGSRPTKNCDPCQVLFLLAVTRISPIHCSPFAAAKARLFPPIIFPRRETFHGHFPVSPSMKLAV